MIAILFAVIAASPASELRAATQDLVTQVAPQDRSFTRYLTTYSLLPAERAEARQIANFWINSLSTRRRLSPALPVTDTLLRIDLRDYAWSPDSWERMTLKSHYVRLGWVDPKDEVTFREYSKSAMALVRLDHFVSLTSLEPHYSDFLKLPGTLTELQRQFGVQEKDVKALSLNAGGAVLRSIVALHNRQLERYPTITGYFWLSRDSKTNSGKQAVLDNLFGITPDGGEFIWSLPNELQAYYLADGNGKQVNVVPADIAQDSVTTFADKQVRNARSCVVCHAGGINKFDDIVSSLIDQGKIELRSYDKDKTIAIEELYLSQIEQQIDDDNRRFVAAVEATSGLTPEVNAAAFQRLVYGFLERQVSPSQASLELGVEEEWLGEYLAGSYSGTLLAILAGHSVSRDAWESVFPEAIKRVYLSRVNE